MRRAHSGLCILLIICYLSSAYPDDPMTEYQEQTDQFYGESAGCAAVDGQHTAISASMIGWGLGLAVAIALITGLLNQNTAHAHD